MSQNIINEFETIEFRLRQLSNRTKPYDLCYDETIKKYQFKWSKKQTDSIWLDDLQFKLVSSNPYWLDIILNKYVNHSPTETQRQYSTQMFTRLQSNDDIVEK